VTESTEFDAAVEVGVAAFCAGKEPPSDDEVRQRLTGAGVEPWLAERLLIFLPMAFTRRLLPDVSYQDRLVTPDGPVDLSAERVFVAAAGRAHRASRGEVARIAVRSSEFNAINNLMNGGSKLPDIRLTEVALVENLAPVEQGDGGVPSPRAVFAGLLRGHDVALDSETKIAAKLSVHPAPAGVVMAQVDFALSHPALAKPWLVESFAGHGNTWRAAIGEAVSKFSLGALHPIIGGLLRPGTAPDQVERERYEHPNGPFELVLGAQMNLFTDRPVPAARPLLQRCESSACSCLATMPQRSRLASFRDGSQLQLSRLSHCAGRVLRPRASWCSSSRTDRSPGCSRIPARAESRKATS
jgi:hypothetical protein